MKHALKFSTKSIKQVRTNPLDFPYMIEHRSAMLTMERPQRMKSGKWLTMFTAVLFECNYHKTVVLKQDVTTDARARRLLKNWMDTKIPLRALGHIPKPLFADKRTNDEELPEFD